MKKIFINISALICLLTCAGEFISLCILGKYYPGYSQLKNTMSQLGVSVSPVSSEISLWWIISGLLFTIFGIGVWIAFMGRGKPARLASLLIILYGLGEGIGSGIFKADLVPSGITISYIIHDIFGGVGVLAVLILPLAMRKVFSVEERPGFYRFSGILFFTGILTVFLFLFRYYPDQDMFLAKYKGFWQRLFMLNTYIYFTVIAVIMLTGKGTFNTED